MSESDSPQRVQTLHVCSVSCTTVTQYLLQTTCYKIYFDVCESDCVVAHDLYCVFLRLQVNLPRAAAPTCIVLDQ